MSTGVYLPPDSFVDIVDLDQVKQSRRVSSVHRYYIVFAEHINDEDITGTEYHVPNNDTSVRLWVEASDPKLTALLRECNHDGSVAALIRSITRMSHTSSHEPTSSVKKTP